MMLRRLPGSVSQNHGRRVLKYCNTLNEFDGVVSVLLARIMDRKPQAWSISADMHFDLAKSSKLMRSSACPFESRLFLFSLQQILARHCEPSDSAVSAEHECVVACLTGQPLLGQFPLRKFLETMFALVWLDICDFVHRVTCVPRDVRPGVGIHHRCHNLQ